MRPVLFELSWGEWRWEVPAYSAFLALAFLLTFSGGWQAMRAQGIPSRRAIRMLLISALAAVVGARLWYAALHWGDYLESPERLWSLNRSGLAFDGGLLFGAATVWLLSRRTSVSFARLADRLVVVVAVGWAVARVGCLLQGCCFGRETSLPWGICYPAGSPAEAVATLTSLALFQTAETRWLHPTPVYEAVGVLGVAGWCWWRGRQSLPPGRVAVEGWCGFYTVRLVTDLFRSPDTLVLPWTMVIHAAFLVAGTLRLTSARIKLNVTLLRIGRVGARRQVAPPTCGENTSVAERLSYVGKSLRRLAAKTSQSRSD